MLIWDLFVCVWFDIYFIANSFNIMIRQIQYAVFQTFKGDLIPYKQVATEAHSVNSHVTCKSFKR